MSKITRRNFLEVAGVAGAAMALAACGGSNDAGSDEKEGEEEPEGEAEAQPEADTDIYAAPDASAYPIEADGADVEALYTTEEIRAGWTKATNPNGVEIGCKDAAKIIQVAGLAFRDMNGDGKLDLWEDWRQDADARAAALAAALPYDECMKLMFHGGAETFVMPGMETDEEVVPYALCARGSRAGVTRAGTTIDSYATDISWVNDVQGVCEDSEWGIPYWNSTDQYQLFGLPDNLAIAGAFDKDVWRKAGMWLGRAWRSVGMRCLLGPQVDLYSQPLGCRFSGSVGDDPALNRDFAQAFSAGLQSTWGDDEATEDLGWGKDSVSAMLKHFFTEGSVEGGRNDHADAGRYNVFPGDNIKAHLVPFVDGGMKLDSVTGQMDAVMPCYGVLYDEDERYGENVGNGYNKKSLDILRDLGWDGVYCTDWGILTSQTYGVGDLTEPERYAKMVLAGEDQYGGDFRDDLIEDSFKLIADELGEDGALERVRESARRISKAMIHVGLFDQPFSNPQDAKEILESEAAAAFGLEAAQKSVVMLKNANGTISADGIQGKVYMPLSKNEPSMFVVLMGGDPTPTFETAIEPELLNGVEAVTDTVEGEDIVPASAEDLAGVEYVIIKGTNPTDANDGVTGGVSLMGGDTGEPRVFHPITLQYEPYTADGANVRKESLAHVDEAGEYENRSYFGESSAATNHDLLETAKRAREACPDAKIILLVEATRPMVFAEIEPYVDAILFTWTMQVNLQNAAWASIVNGEYEPSGLLVDNLPKDMDVVEASCEDVPRDVEPYVDSEGNAYEFCYGLNWGGVIDDARVATYKVDPLTEPETEVAWEI